MVERVKITPSQIVLKDSGGNIKFNTDYAYIKTGGGTLFAGGYQRAPAIYGQNSISDNASLGSYTSNLYSGATINFGQTQTFYWTSPRSSNLQFKFVDHGRDLGQVPFKSANTRTLRYLNYDTQAFSDTSITYRWVATRYGYGADEYGNPTSIRWVVFPEFTSLNFPTVANQNGGAFEVSYTGNEYGNWSRTLTSTDEYSNTTSTTQYGNQFYTSRTATNEYGQTYTIPAETMYWRTNGLFTLRNPEALSLAVTP